MIALAGFVGRALVALVCADVAARRARRAAARSRSALVGSRCAS